MVSAFFLDFMIYQPTHEKLFEEYGAVSIGLIVSVIFMVVFGPVGDFLGESVKKSFSVHVPFLI